MLAADHVSVILTGVRLVPSMMEMETEIRAWSGKMSRLLGIKHLATLTETLQKDAAKDVDIELPWSEFKELLDGLEDKFGQEHMEMLQSLAVLMFRDLEKKAGPLLAVSSYLESNGLRLTFRQMIHADQKLFLELSDLTRTGIQATATGRPMDAQVPIASALHEVMCLLQPLPLAGQAGRSASSWDKGDQDRPERFMPYGKGKPKGKGAGKGKFSPVPTALRGRRSHTNKGNPICFGYGLGTCKNAVKNNSCEKGLHILAKLRRCSPGIAVSQEAKGGI